MKTFKSKLIVLRGNSGSGKSTVAKLLKERLKERKFALVEQDYLRRNILGVKDKKDGPQQKLIYNVVKYCLKEEYEIVLLEGILTFSIYEDLLKKIEKLCPNNFFYYFKLSLDETLKRHNTKSEDFKQAIPQDKIKSWYLENDLTNFASEKIISEEKLQNEIVDYIIKTSRL